MMYNNHFYRRLNLFSSLLFIQTALCIAQTAPGTLDAGFGTAGVVSTHLGGAGEVIRGVAVQADGKIVAVGNNNLLRYSSDGSLDLTFGTGGVAGGQPFTLTGVAIQADGKIVACGFAPGLSGQSDFVAARFLAHGAPDLTFNNTGRTTVSIAGNTEDIATCVAILPSGKILVGGHAKEPGQHERFALMQCLPAGPLDPTFGNAGKLRTDVGSSRDMAHALAVQADGKILLAGQAGNGSHWDFAVVRYTATGALDNNFGVGGKAFVGYPGNVDDYCFGIQTDAKNRIVLGGKTGTNGGNFNFAAARLLSSGALDNAFGTSGRAVLNTPSLDDHAGALLQHPDGTVFLAGNADKRLMVAAFDSLGTPFAAFGASGVALADFGVPVNVQGHTLALAPDGKLVAAGGVLLSGGNWDYALARFLNTPLTTSLQQVFAERISDLRLYPNPATTQTTLTFDLEADTQFCIEVRNSTGALLSSIRTDTASGRQLIPIELDPAWPAGVYHVILTMPNSIHAMPVLKF